MKGAAAGAAKVHAVQHQHNAPHSPHGLASPHGFAMGGDGVEMAVLTRMVREASRGDLFMEENLDRHLPLWKQAAARKLYEGNVLQTLIALLIVLNFVISALQAQLLPSPGSTLDAMFTASEIFFAVVFALELVLNMYASFFAEFWVGDNKWWNVFDFVIVTVSVVSVVLEDLPSVSVLRLFRAFRVFRLFRRIGSLRLIIEGVIAAIPGVTNAFVIIILVMGIWSIMGVQFFRDVSEEAFGNFLRALFTMWQVMTADSWSSAIARDIIYANHLPMAALYFVSFICLTSIILTNVVVAILLENFLAKAKEYENEQMVEKNERRSVALDSLADPVVVSRLTNECIQAAVGNTAELQLSQLVYIFSVLWDCPDTKQIVRGVIAEMVAEGRLDAQSSLLVRFVDR